MFKICRVSCKHFIDHPAETWGWIQWWQTSAWASSPVASAVPSFILPPAASTSYLDTSQPLPPASSNALRPLQPALTPALPSSILGRLPLEVPLRLSGIFFSFKKGFRIRGILIQIRDQDRYRAGSGFESFSFWRWLSRCHQKIIFLRFFFFSFYRYINISL